MYWQPVVRKFEPLSDGMRYTLSAIDPTTVPVIRPSEMVAAGNWQVGAPLTVSVNFTGTTPRLALNTLDPSALMGG